MICGAHDFWAREWNDEFSSNLKKLLFLSKNLLSEVPGKEKIVIRRLRPCELRAHHRHPNAGDKFALFQRSRVASIVEDILTYAAVVEKNGRLGRSAIPSYTFSLLP